MYLKSVLRYPGGKSKAIPQLIHVLPQNIKEYREPMAGGGALYLYLRQHFKSINSFWINDINYDLSLFWSYAKDKNLALINQINDYLTKFSSGKKLFYYLRNGQTQFTDVEKAARFFIMNRISFSGTTEAGGYSEESWLKRMTTSSIDRISVLASIMINTKVTCSDYSECLFEEGQEVFIFLDPPYFSAKKSKLYGKNGCNHIFFDFELLADNLRKCNHNWLMTLDDSPFIREIFSFANIKEWSLQYGMNNVYKTSSLKGQELFISNYKFQEYTIFDYAN